MECITCKQNHSSLFCPYCGEDSTIERLSFKSIIASSIHSLTNLDKGFLYNLKGLTLFPKQLITNYIGGQRKFVLNPFLYLVISMSLYILANHFIPQTRVWGNDRNTTEPYTKGFEKGVEIGLIARAFLKDYFKYFWFLSVPLLSFATSTLFKKYNFTEHLVINSFIIGHATLAVSILYIIVNVPIIANPILYIGLITLLSLVFGLRKLTVLKSFLSVLLMFIQVMILLFMIGYFLAE